METSVNLPRDVNIFVGFSGRNKIGVRMILPLKESTEEVEMKESSFGSPFVGMCQPPGIRSDGNHSDNDVQNDINNLLDLHKPSTLVCLTSIEEIESLGLLPLFDEMPRLQEQGVNFLFFPLSVHSFESSSDREKLRILVDEISTGYKKKERILLFCGTDLSRSSVILACTLLDLEITQSIKGSLKILQDKSENSDISDTFDPYPTDTLEKYRDCMGSFETSFYNHFEGAKISKCVALLQETKEENYKQLEVELKTFFQLIRLEKHRDHLWKCTPLLFPHLNLPSKNIQIEAARCLQQILLHKKARRDCIIKKDESIQAIKKALDNEPSEELASILFSTMSTLIMENKDIAELFVIIGGLSTLKKFLIEGTAAAAASATLRLISSFRGLFQTAIRESEVFPSLITLLEAREGKVVIQSCDTIQNLALANEENRKALCKADAVQHLITRIENAPEGDPLCLILLQTLTALTSTHIDIQKTFQCAHAIELSIKLLEEGSNTGPNNIQTCEFASQILRDILYKNKINQGVAAEKGGIPVLVLHLQSIGGREKIVACVLDCIWAMTESNENIVKSFLNNNIFQVFRPTFFHSLALSLQEDPSAEIPLVTALRIISNMGRHSVEAQEECREVKCLEIIIHFLVSSDLPSGVQQSAADVLASVCKLNIDNSEMVVEKGGFHKLVQLLGSEDAAILDSILCAISSILEQDDESHRILVEEGGIPPLLSCLSSAAWPLKCEAAFCIHLLSIDSEEHRTAILKSGAIPLLVSSLDTNQQKVVEVVAESINSLMEGNAQDFKKSGLVPILMSHLSRTIYYTTSGILVQNIASVRVSCLSTLIYLAVGNASNIDAMCKGRGLERILCLLQSPSEEIIARVLALVWIISDGGSKYQNLIRAVNEDIMVSIFASVPELLLHCEEAIALNACGAMCSLSRKNHKNVYLFMENEAKEILHSMPNTANPRLQEQMARAIKIFGS